MKSGEVHLACASSNRIISEIFELARIFGGAEWSEEGLLERFDE
jgi:hypothetical protein